VFTHIAHQIVKKVLYIHIKDKSIFNLFLINMIKIIKKNDLQTIYLYV